MVQEPPSSKKHSRILAFFAPKKYRSRSESEHLAAQARSLPFAAPPRDRHNTCLTARRFQEAHHSAQQRGHEAALAGIPATVCPIARQILAKRHATHDFGRGSAPAHAALQRETSSKHGVPRLPRGSLTNDKLPFLDNALASVALFRSLSAHDDDYDRRRDDRVSIDHARTKSNRGGGGGDEDEDEDSSHGGEHVEQLIVHETSASARRGPSIIATVPVLSKSSFSSGPAATTKSPLVYAHDAPSSFSPSTHSSSREGSVSTQATSERTDDGSRSAPALNRKAAQFVPCQRLSKTAAGVPRPLLTVKVPLSKSAGAGPGAGAGFGGHGDDEKESLVAHPVYITDYTPRDSMQAPFSAFAKAGPKPRFLARFGISGRAPGSAPLLTLNGTDPPSKRSSMMSGNSRASNSDAKRLSLLALNAMGGHAPQMEYYNQVATR
ncbi:unnamed protein product [Parajaminaea phylloscopi]